MLILGIETSCDETAASVVRSGREVLSNVVASQIDAHRIYGGVVPEIASRMHSEAISRTVNEAILQSGVSLSSIDAIAVTACPGLIGALLVGVNFAKGLALSLDRPLIPVHHLRGHVASSYISFAQLKPPFLCLLASGGHSHIVQVQDYTSFKVIARTRDDAAGEAFDKAARCMGLPYPGGVEIDRIAETGNDLAYSFPRPRVDGSPLDYSFSGLKTSVVNLMHRASQKNQEIHIADLAASFRKAVIEYLLDKFIAAADQTGAQTLAVAGGVSANALLRRMLPDIASNRACYLPELKYCGDNAAMIAAQGFYEYQAGQVSGLFLNAYPTMPIDALQF